MGPAFNLDDILPDTPEIFIAHVGASMLPNHREPYSSLVERGLARVVGFEPNKAEHDKLLARFGPGYTFLPYFIGAGGPATFYETTLSYTGSLLEPNTALLEQFQTLAEVTKVVATHPVMTHRLDDIAELPSVDFLKIDVQGAEIDAFKGGEKLLQNCILLETEVEFAELYKGQPLFADVDQYVRARGFQLHTIRNTCGRCFKPLLAAQQPTAALNQILWADAVYVRDLTTLERLSTEKLCKLAHLVHEVYGSADLCLAILVELDRRTGKGALLEDAYFDRLALVAPQPVAP